MTRGSSIDAGQVLARVLCDGPDTLITRGEAAALIASRVKDPGDSPKASRNRVGMQLDRAGARGSDVHRGGGLAIAPNGCYTVDEIARWANGAYPGLFEDLPIKPRQHYVVCNERAGLGSSTAHEVTPGNLEDCQDLVKQLRERLRLVDAEQALAEADRKRKLVANFKRK